MSRRKDATTYLVTGGCGFIGSYVTRDLLEEGERVIIYDYETDQGILDQVIDREKLRGVILIQGEILDFIHLAETIKAHSVEKIVHLASPLIRAAEENPSMALDSICKGTLNVFEAAKKLEVKKVVWASSIAVFGAPESHPEDKITNDSPHRPHSVYGACKSLNEYMASHYADRYGVDSIGLRYTLVYGPGRVGTTKGAFATEMIRKAARKEAYEVPFSDETVDWQYVEDVSRLAVTASKANRTQTRVFNTRGDLRPVKEVIDYIRGLVPDVKFTLKPGIYGLPMDFDTSPLERELGFKPRYSMEQGVLKTLNTFRTQAGLDEVEG